MPNGMQPITQLNPIALEAGKKVYFASDQHLGAPTPALSLPRELRFVQWLDQTKVDAQAIFLVGDLFDFWFEYKTVVPKGFVRVLGKLAELRQLGIPIYFFVGNHDLWMADYFATELDIPVFHDNVEVEINGELFLIGHGDGKGPGDYGYKRMKKVFTHPLSKWLFRWLHPDVGVRLAQYLSVKNKLISGDEDVKFLGPENEWLIQYSDKKSREKPYRYLIFGHRHLPMIYGLNKQSAYVNLGDWITYFTFGEYTANGFNLYAFTNDGKKEVFQSPYSNS